jgi:hypothetical protein
MASRMFALASASVMLSPARRHHLTRICTYANIGMYQGMPTALSMRSPSVDAIYVVHAFQKKSKAGIATAKSDVELVRQRLKQLRNEVKNAEKKSP